jgi:hypothetical protein
MSLIVVACDALTASHPGGSSLDRLSCFDFGWLLLHSLRL